MNDAPRPSPVRTPNDHSTRARARRNEARKQATEQLMAGRTLDRTPVEELSAEERAVRFQTTKLAFEGL